jgi:rSAM/selenodomain-associated transferase 1
MPHEEGRRTAIAIMARSPTSATRTIKTRLRATIPDDDARAAIYRAFLSDTIDLVRRVSSADLRVAYTPEGGSDGFSTLGIDPQALLAQRGDDIGARERAIFEALFAEGYEHVVVMGSDFPTLLASVLEDACAALARDPFQIVLGPAVDGGYYLIGLSSPSLSGHELPDVFSGVRWSTCHALADTLACAEVLGREVVLVQEWFDVDDEDGWARLTASLEDTVTASRARHTAHAVAALRHRDTRSLR